MQTNLSGEHDVLLEATLTLPIGTLVSTTLPLAGFQAGIPGVVYHSEHIDSETYVSVLLKNGTDIGAFNLVQTEQMLEEVGFLPLAFRFTTTSALMDAYGKGVFDRHFEQEQACNL